MGASGLTESSEGIEKEEIVRKRTDHWRASFPSVEGEFSGKCYLLPVPVPLLAYSPKDLEVPFC